MEIKTCEEYVLKELEEAKENLLKLAEYNNELRTKNETLERDIRFIAINTLYNKLEGTFTIDLSDYNEDVVKSVKKTLEDYGCKGI